MSSTSPRQGLSKTLRSSKSRLFVILTLVLLTAVFSASALTANMNGPIGQQAGSITANLFSMFSGSSVLPQASSTPPKASEDLANDVGKIGGDSGVVVETSNPELACPTANGTIATGDTTMQQRMFRDAAQSTCGGKVFPGTFDAGSPHRYDVLNYVNNSGSTCVTVTVTVPDTSIFAAAYVGGFDPNNMATNYVGDAGSSITQPFSFNVPLGATYQIVVMDVNGNDAVTHNYSVDTDSCGPTSCVAPPANMVAWYPGQSGTSVADIIGDPPNNGTFQGTAQYAPGKVGNAFNFNGASGIQVPSSTALNVGAAPNTGISIDAWINPTATTQMPIVEWNNGVNYGVHFWHSVGAAGNLYANVTDTAGFNHIASTAAGVVPAGSFTHVAFTFDNATKDYNFYANGVNVGSGTLAGVYTPQTGYSMYIGRRPSGGPDFNGLVDEVEVFNRVITGAEVASINGAGSFGKCHTSQIQFDTAAQGVAENAGSVTLTMKRIGANDTSADVQFATAPGTAVGGAGCAAGVDYNNLTIPTVSFGPGERTQTATVTICDDAVDENDETFTGNLTNVTGTGASLGAIPVQTVTILDNDAIPNMTINNANGVEGTPPGAGGSATFTVTKTGATDFSSSVIVTPTNSSAAGGASCSAGIDFINTPTTLTFPASTTTDTQNVTVNFCPDSSIEGDEVFAMVLTPTGATAGGNGTGTIKDDDSSVQFTSATYSGTEGSGGGTTTFNLSVSRTGTGSALPAATVDASTIQVGGTAVGNNSCAISGTDYVVVSGQTLSWAAGDTTNKNLVIQVCADNVDENDETLNSQLSNAVNTQIGGQSTAVTTIQDDDAPPSFALTPSTTTVAEGSSATYTVTRSGNETALSTTVNWATTNGTATGGTDFTQTTGSVVFAPGAGGTQTFTIAALNDSLYETNETYTVNLTGASNGSPVSGTNTTTITSADPAPTFAINDVTQAELNSGSSAFIFTVTRTGNAQANQIVTFNTSDGGGAFAATAPSDYTAIPSDTVTFTQGQTSRQIAVIVNGDTTFENNETFSVNLVSANFGSFTDNLGLGTITNDDSAPVFVLSPTAGSPNETVNEGNTGTTPARFTITKTGATELSSTVTVNTVDGSATAGSDYVALVNAAVATFAPADTVKTFDVTVNGDTIYENTETFTVNLSNVTNGTFGAVTSGTGTITNDDIAPVLTISSTTPTVTEGGTTVWTITRSFTAPTTGTALNASASCTGSVIDANSTTHAQSNDFSTGSQTISFAPGDANTKQCNIATTQDTVFEGNETFSVSLGSPSGATVAGGPFTGTINNDDACSFAVSNVSLPEGNAGTTTFNHVVTKTCDTGGNTALVSYDSTDGSATAPSDYTSIIPGTLIFQANETTKPMPVLVNGDLTVEPDETFNVRLTGGTVNGVTIPTLTNGVGTILNDDGQPISISGTITNFSPAGPLAGVQVCLTGSVNPPCTTTNAAGAYSFTGLLSGGNYLVTPTLAGKTMSPITRSYTGITASVTTANFVAYDNGNIPRTLNVQNAYTNPGSPVTVPILLTAQGDEASLSFSLNYNTAILSSPTVACGADAPGCVLLANTGTPGVIGISVDPAASGVFAAGNRQVVTVTFVTAPTAAPNTPVTFGDSPTLRRSSDSGSNPLPTAYNNGFVVFAQGLESDTAARNSGDGSVLPGDVIQVRRFVTALDSPNPAFNEFQRADSAPAATKGNGFLDAGDVIQARRYSTVLDPTQTAGGPFVPAVVAPAEEIASRADGVKGGKSSTSVGRVLRALNATGGVGTQVNVCIEIDSQGDEAAVQTTVGFDSTKLSISGISSPNINPDVTLGSGVAAGTSLTVNGNQASAGRIGWLIDSGNNLALGTRQIVCLRFTIIGGANTTTPIVFGNVPVPTSISDNQGNPLTAALEQGLVTILGPTAAGVSVSGRVTTATGAGLRGATVTMTDSHGVTRTATTSTFGYYQFEDVEAGNNYIVGVTSRRYRFAPRSLQVLDNLTDVDFVGQE